MTKTTSFDMQNKTSGKSRPPCLFFSSLVISVVAAIGFLWTAGAQTGATDSLWTARGCVDDARGSWFRNAKFGAFIHFGLYSELGGYYHGKGPYDPAEQIMGLGERHMVIPWKTYETEVGGSFNPTNFNAHEWVSLIKRAGQKYLIVTAKHHDGFCMFRTSTTRFNVVDSTPFGRDVIRELAIECRKQGIAFCIYYSIGDWSASQVKNPRYKTYKDYMFAQLKELLTQYGPVKMLWFDNYWYVDNQWEKDLPHAKELYAYVRSLQPDILINDRCGRGATSTDGDYGTPENQLKGSLQSRYFEVVMTDTDDDNWGWVQGATNYRSPTEIIRNLIDCASKGGNFVLNVGPAASGEFPPEHVALIQAVGSWMDVNGKAIYETSPAPEVEATADTNFVYYATKKGQHIYLHVIKWPDGPAKERVRIHRSRLEKAELLDPKLKGFAATSSETNGVTTVVLERPEAVDPFATVIQFDFNPE